jgi:hypothetical protein
MAAPLYETPGRLSGFDRVPLRSQWLLTRLACSSDDQVARRRSRASQFSERLTWGFPALENPLLQWVWVKSGSAFQADDADSIPAARFLFS